MKLIQETDYAFRIMLALFSQDDMLSAGVISEKVSITEGFTKKILNKLIKHQLIKSRRGIDGGYMPARPATQVTLRDVVRAIEGELHINRCLVEDSECNRVTDKQMCAIHRELNRVNTILSAELSRTDFAQLITNTDTKSTY